LEETLNYCISPPSGFAWLSFKFFSTVVQIETSTKLSVLTFFTYFFYLVVTAFDDVVQLSTRLKDKTVESWIKENFKVKIILFKLSFILNS